jgi:hypothetical protein
MIALRSIERSSARQSTRNPSMTWGKLAAAPFLVLCLALAACDGDGKVDTSKLEKSFSSSQPAAKSALDDVKGALAAKDFAKAGAALQRLASSANLTAEQRQAIEDVSAQVRKLVSEKANEIAKEGEKALGDVQKRLSN